MRVVHTRDEVRAAVAELRGGGGRSALVPTMGALHEGHLRLIDRARELADWVAVSVFVNPLQFGPTEDLARYPRDLGRDVELAASRGADLLFAPAAAEMYAHGAARVAVVPKHGADRLCGASRPGHFEGVLTVVAKLFGIFTPDVAVFGQKDFQQATLVRHMVDDLDMPLRVDVVATVRDADGLAMSSRNAYLAPAERDAALSLSRSLRLAQQLFDAGEADAEVVRTAVRNQLASSGVLPEYVDVVEPATLDPVLRLEAGAVVVLAARAGATRLIDNAILTKTAG